MAFLYNNLNIPFGVLISAHYCIETWSPFWLRKDSGLDEFYIFALMVSLDFMGCSLNVRHHVLVCVRPGLYLLIIITLLS